MPNINMIRINSKLEDLYDGKIDVTDHPDEQALFYSRALAALAIMVECGVDADVASKSVTDGYHDMGIDAIYCDDMQKKLVLVQSKWRSDGKGSISQKESLEFVEGISRIMSLEFDGANPKIIHKIPEITSAIKSMDYQVLSIFCHTGSQDMPPYAKRPVNTLLANTNDDTNKILDFYEIKISDVFKYLASGQEADNICLDDVLLTNWGKVDEPMKAYYGTISAAALGTWFNSYGNHLFAQNIRFYKGSTEVNQGMRKVLQDEPEKFFYYNNGVKMLCKKVIRKAAYGTNNKMGLFSLEGVSVVNGAQTTGTIGTFFNENPEQTERATVFIQLIDLGESGENCALQITKLSNTQNKIDSKEFAALDPQQDRLKNELMFSGIFYLYKSGALINDLIHQVSIDEAIIAQACYQDEVTYAATAKRNIGALTDDIQKAPYKVLFNAGTNAFAMKNSIEIMRALDKYLQTHEGEYQGRSKLVLIHGNRFMLYLVLQNLKINPDFNIKMMAVTDIAESVAQISPKIISNVVEAMNQVFPDAYPANIFKNVGRCREIIAAMGSITG